jgi:hypothetical protein
LAVPKPVVLANDVVFRIGELRGDKILVLGGCGLF